MKINIRGRLMKGVFSIIGKCRSIDGQWTISHSVLICNDNRYNMPRPYWTMVSHFDQD